jgi:hypothetical protein
MDVQDDQSQRPVSLSNPDGIEIDMMTAEVKYPNGAHLDNQTRVEKDNLGDRSATGPLSVIILELTDFDSGRC